MKIEFLITTFGNDVGDIVEVIQESDKEIYYEDGFERYCYLNKDEEGTTFKYIK